MTYGTNNQDATPKTVAASVNESSRGFFTNLINKFGFLTLSQLRESGKLDEETRARIKPSGKLVEKSRQLVEESVILAEKSAKLVEDSLKLVEKSRKVQEETHEAISDPSVSADTAQPSRPTI